MGGGDVEEPQLCQTFQGFPHLGFGAVFLKKIAKSRISVLTDLLRWKRSGSLRVLIITIKNHPN